MRPIIKYPQFTLASPAVGCLLCLLSIGVFIAEIHYPPLQLDDAYIAYRYAHNLLQGNGLVYNPGEYIEGMPNLLWTLLIAFGMKLGYSPETAAYSLSILLGSVTLLFTFLYSSYRIPREWIWFSGFAPWIVLSSTAFPLWATSGMEVPLLTLCITGILIMATYQNMAGSAFFALALTFARSEGVIIAILAFLYTWPTVDTKRKQWFILFILYGICFVGLTLFRMTYYGSAVPISDNSLNLPDLLSLFFPAWIKGLLSLYNFFFSGALLLVVPSALGVIIDGRHKPALLYCTIVFIYVLSIDTDAWSTSLFLSTCLPCLSASAIYGCAKIWQWNRSVALGVATGIVASPFLHAFGEAARLIAYTHLALSLIILINIFQERKSRQRTAICCICGSALLILIPLHRPVQIRWPILRTPSRNDALAFVNKVNTSTKKKTDFLIKNMKSKQKAPVVAIANIGRFGFNTGYPIIDLLGRVEPEIARMRKNRFTSENKEQIPQLTLSHTLQRHPDYVCLIDEFSSNRSISKTFIKSDNFRDHYTWDTTVDCYARRNRPRMTQEAIDARFRANPKKKMPEARPNIVLITIDTLRFDHLESYGYFRNTTPSISRLAEEGILFKQAVSQAPWTLPSMATMMTSLYPSEHRTHTSRSGLHKRLITIAQVLKYNNYLTAGVVSNHFLAKIRGFARGFDRFDENMVPNQDQITSSMVTEIATEMMASTDREPFFLWVHYMDPHYTYIRHPEVGFATEYQGIFSDRITILQLSDLINRQGLIDYSRIHPIDFIYLNAVYDEEIAFTDASIGRLIQALTRLGHAHPTVILIAADHGEFLGEHNEFGHKEYLYEEMIHVPLIIGGEINESLRGQVVRQTVENRYIPFTLMKLAKISRHPFRGNDLMEIAEGKRETSVAYAETSDFWSSDREAKSSISYENWKLIYNHKRRSYEFYRIDIDKGERNNLWERMVSANTSKQLKIWLDDFIKRNSALGRGNEYNFHLSPDQEKSLRDLGYIQ